MCSYSSSAQTQQRRVPMMGGYSAADVNDPSVTKAAQFAVSSGAPNSKYTFALMDDTYWIRVIKAEQQVGVVLISIGLLVASMYLWTYFVFLGCSWKELQTHD